MKRLSTALVALFMAATATAGDLKFEYDSAELTTLEGIKSTHQRLTQAATLYCQDLLHGTRSMTRQSSCVRQVKGEILAGIDDSRLTAYAAEGTVDPALLARR